MGRQVVSSHLHLSFGSISPAAMAPISTTNDSDPNDLNVSSEIIRYQDGSPFQLTFEILQGATVFYHAAKSLFTSLSYSRINENAFSVCFKIGKGMRLSRKGQDRFNKAKEDLTVVSAFESLLRFGFKWNGPITKILAYDEGERFAALTACLTEAYTASKVAEIYIALINLIIERNPRDQFLQGIAIPSQQEIRVVVERFAGIFSTSEFGALVEDYMSMDNHAVITGGTQPRKQATRFPTYRLTAYTQYIAGALFELMQLSRDNSKTRQVQFVGGADGVALAAIGIFLLDLPTEIYQSNKDSMEMIHHRYHSPDEKPRVIAIISDDMLNTTKVTQSRVVYLHPMSNIIQQNKEMNPDLVIGGRCRRNEVLSRTFPGSFQRLMGIHAQFSPAIGSAARIFQALAER